MNMSFISESYQTPQVECISLHSVSVLCQSLEPGESEDGILGDEL